MITIITEMTDSNIFTNYWVPLIYKHRDSNFIFGKCKELKRPMMSDWRNVIFSNKSIDDLVEQAKTEIIYITKQNEIPTYELMVKFREPVEGIVPKNYITKEDSSSFTALKSKYPNFKKNNINVMTYVI